MYILHRAIRMQKAFTSYNFPVEEKKMSLSAVFWPDLLRSKRNYRHALHHYSCSPSKAKTRKKNQLPIVQKKWGAYFRFTPSPKVRVSIFFLFRVFSSLVSSYVKRRKERGKKSLSYWYLNRTLVVVGWQRALRWILTKTLYCAHCTTRKPCQVPRTEKLRGEKATCIARLCVNELGPNPATGTACLRTQWEVYWNQFFCYRRAIFRIMSS